MGKEDKKEWKEVRMERKSKARRKRKGVTTARMHNYLALMGRKLVMTEVLVETKKHHKIVGKVSIFKVFKI